MSKVYHCYVGHGKHADRMLQRHVLTRNAGVSQTIAADGGQVRN